MFGTTLGRHLMRDGERSARLLTSRTASNGYKPAATSGNALPHFSGGQVVAGSNCDESGHVMSRVMSARPRKVALSLVVNRQTGSPASTSRSGWR